MNNTPPQQVKSPHDPILPVPPTIQVYALVFVSIAVIITHLFGA